MNAMSWQPVLLRACAALFLLCLATLVVAWFKNRKFKNPIIGSRVMPYREPTVAFHIPPSMKDYK